MIAIIRKKLFSSAHVPGGHDDSHPGTLFRFRQVQNATVAPPAVARFVDQAPSFRVVIHALRIVLIENLGIHVLLVMLAIRHQYSTLRGWLAHESVAMRENGDDLSLINIVHCKQAPTSSIPGLLDRALNFQYAISNCLEREL